MGNTHREPNYNKGHAASLSANDTPLKHYFPLICKADPGLIKYKNEFNHKINDMPIGKVDKKKVKNNMKLNDDKDDEEVNSIWLIIEEIIGRNKTMKKKNYKDIREYFENQMKDLLQIKRAPMTCDGIDDESKWSDCKIKHIQCLPLRRIRIVLKTYDKVIKTKVSKKNLIDSTAMSFILSIQNVYGHQQLYDDFQHVQKHCKNKRFKTYVCEYFIEKFDCKECKFFRRHYRDRNDTKSLRNLYFRQFPKSKSKSMQIINDREAIFQQECDKIHTFFCHPPDMYINASRRKTDGITAAEQNQIMEQIGSAGLLKVGNMKKAEDPQTTTDNKWFRSANLNQKDDKMYDTLLSKIGVFRWQQPYGFVDGSGQTRAMCHWRPRFENIKEEVLHNKYHPLDPQNWNETVKKCKVFQNSMTAKKIRTKYDGYYLDNVTNKIAKWKRGARFSSHDIVTLKLYTDFDTLQYELKKCFRFVHSTNGSFDDDEYKSARSELVARICAFYHWRGALMVTLNKFGTKLKNKALYTGINAKMILDPSGTFSFHGPFSTTTSEHVAHSFATTKGMVLKITSQFPGLSYCNAFDASKLSDFPEEEEWLIGFMFVRLLNIKTDNLVEKFENFFDLERNNVSVGSWMREQFLAIHLFQKQIFSIDGNMQYMLAQFLRVHRRECCDVKHKSSVKYSNGWNQQMKHLCISVTNHASSMSMINASFEMNVKRQKSSEGDLKIQERLYPILWQKFNEFRLSAICIKFDRISDVLKDFFMDEIDVKDIHTGQKKWIISFDKILNIYPNAQRLIFLNEYKFNKHIKRKLINVGNENKLQSITFLYFDGSQFKYDDISIGDQSIQNWKISKKYISKQTAETGFKISLRRI